MAVLALFCALLLLDAALTGSRIHSGITVAGVGFGRSTQEKAVQRLQGLVDESKNKPIILVRDEYRWPVLPEEFGVKIDVQSTIDEALAVTRKGNIFQKVAKRISLYFKKQDVALHGSIDPASMDKIISMVAKKLDDPPVNAGLKFQGDEIAVVEGKDGFVVDQEALRESLKRLLLTLHATELEIAMVTASPSIRSADTSGAIEEARTMISGPVKLTSGDSSWSMSAEQIKTSLDFTVTGTAGQERLTSFISPEKGAAFFDKVNEDVKVAPKKATWETDGETATIIPATVGKGLDYSKTGEAMTVAAKSTGQRAAKATLKDVQPERTTEQAQEMGIVSSIGDYTTEFSGSENRISNIGRAAEIINNTLVGPGETFSFNGTVGERTSERGFKTAPVIGSDGRLQDDLGGGICQVATTLFNAAFFSGLNIVERNNHLLYIDHYPMGRDATVSWGWPDLRFQNDTDHWLLIKAYADSSSITFVLYGTPDGRKVTYNTSDWFDIVEQTEKRESTDELAVGETRVADPGQTGRSCLVTRTVTRDGATLHKDEFPSTYPMVPKLIQEGTKQPTTTTQRPTTTTQPTPTTGKPTTTATTEPTSD